MEKKIDNKGKTAEPEVAIEEVAVEATEPTSDVTEAATECTEAATECTEAVATSDVVSEDDAILQRYAEKGVRLAYKAGAYWFARRDYAEQYARMIGASVEEVKIK